MLFSISLSEFLTLGSDNLFLFVLSWLLHRLHLLHGLFGSFLGLHTLLNLVSHAWDDSFEDRFGGLHLVDEGIRSLARDLIFLTRLFGALFLFLGFLSERLG